MRNVIRIVGFEELPKVCFIGEVAVGKFCEGCRLHLPIRIDSDYWDDCAERTFRQGNKRHSNFFSLPTINKESCDMVFLAIAIEVRE